jgi:glutamine synthetase
MITLPSTLTTVDQQHGYTSVGPILGSGQWINYKRDYEIAPFNLRVTPYEFALHYDV